MSSILGAVTRKPDYAVDGKVIEEISLNFIDIEKQVRTVFDEVKLKELADSIKEQGLQNPIRVYRKNEGKYGLVLGERRYRAVEMVEGMDSISAIVYDEEPEEKEVRLLQLIENLQREDLGVLELAHGFEDLKAQKMSGREIARSLGVSEAMVSKGLSLLKKMPKSWVSIVEQVCSEYGASVLSLDRLYEIVKIKNTNKRKATFDKLLEEFEVEVVEVQEDEEDAVRDEQCEEKKEEYPNCDELWEALKEILKRSRKNGEGNEVLKKIIQPKKAWGILKEFESK